MSPRAPHEADTAAHGRGRRAVAALFALALGGCGANLQHVSAWKVNCPPDRIQVSDVHRPDAQEGGAPVRWTATCNGKSHRCSGTETDGTMTNTSCVLLDPPSGDAE